MEGLPSHVTPIAWRQVRPGEKYFCGDSVHIWAHDGEGDSLAKYLIVDVKTRRVLVVPEHDLPPTFDCLLVGYFDASDNWVEVPYTIEERRD